MNNKLIRVGTIYIPVKDPVSSAEWYKEKLGAQLNYLDDDKAILNLADISMFLVKAEEQNSNFFDANGTERFVLTYEVDGLEALTSIHADFKERGIKVGEIENRGHAGRNFVFYDLDGNKFDVWSELSQVFKRRFVKEEV
ncbi:VOC family protein [Mesobacillus selenatarsenatis]|uniref:VOC domain-containing protein n=1 Tax=Mesobacillus selenatarsenatis (strain DSM 18680 / JCM 14380 / FERM P-15431 / SF-1) TaxID=1321606 RepID=A0A0A8WZI1_MESS1|nr:VOC family protein [Mesobacillus selenatarsenatis]GAM13140.1 BH3221 unknown [Mesobacillus selenatarsenatis SF-1]